MSASSKKWDVPFFKILQDPLGGAPIYLDADDRKADRAEKSTVAGRDRRQLLELPGCSASLPLLPLCSELLRGCWVLVGRRAMMFAPT